MRFRSEEVNFDLADFFKVRFRRDSISRFFFFFFIFFHLIALNMFFFIIINLNQGDYFMGKNLKVCIICSRQGNDYSVENLNAII